MDSALLIQAAACLLVLTVFEARPAPSGKPPATRTNHVVESLHGVKITDPYRWLEDQNSPETRAWIAAQHAFTRSQIDRQSGLDAVKQRLTEISRVASLSLPYHRGGGYFFSKRAAGQELSVLAVRRGLDGADEVLVDPSGLSKDGSVTVSWQAMSRDGKLAAYAIRQGGEDEVRIRFLNVDTRQHLADELPRARYGSVAIRRDNSGLFYMRQTKQGPRLYYHGFGAPPASDALVYGDKLGPSWFIGCSISRDGRYLTLNVSEGSAANYNEVFIRDLDAGGPIRPLITGIRANFHGQIEGGRMYVQTNWNAPRNRLLAIDLQQPDQKNWKELVPESAAALQGFQLAGGKVFASYLDNVQSRIRVFDPQGKALGEIPLPVAGSTSAILGEWDRTEAFFSFQSFHVPATIYRLDTGTLKTAVWWKSPAPVPSESFDLKQVWYTSKDGARIPMFLLHKKGLKLDGNNPVLLTGYGGFRVAETPSFSSNAVVWAEQGGVFALPNLRGGSEFGEEWHKAGMLDKKQNVFDDFIAAAEWLIAHKYTRPQRLAISGRSNGGLLVGAALTQRPELFQAVICGYPLLDMLRYHQFLVARYWVPEYGSSDDPKQFAWLRAYSPYHNVKKGTKYPSVMFVTGDADTRVAPLHARKMAALLQASTGSERPILLHYDSKAGHSTGGSVSKAIETSTDELGYLFWQLGMLR